jgi:hypothetical protein
LKQAARRIRVALRAYAERENWPPGSYKVYVRASSGEFIHVLLIADSLPSPAGFDEWYRVQKFLEQEFVNAPEILRRLRLGVRSSEQVKEGGLYEIAPDYAEIT